MYILTQGKKIEKKLVNILQGMEQCLAHGSKNISYYYYYYYYIMFKAHGNYLRIDIIIINTTTTTLHNPKKLRLLIKQTLDKTERISLRTL